MSVFKKNRPENAPLLDEPKGQYQAKINFPQVCGGGVVSVNYGKDDLVSEVMAAAVDVAISKKVLSADEFGASKFKMGTFHAGKLDAVLSDNQKLSMQADSGKPLEVTLIDVEDLSPGFAVSGTAGSTGDLASHEYYYDTNDLANMHGKFGILAEMGGVPGLADALRTHSTQGLYADEVGISGNDLFDKRREAYGLNVFPKPPMKSFLSHCYEQLQDPILCILLGAGALSVVVGFLENPEEGWIEGVAILLAVVCVTVVGAGNNYSQDKQFRKLDQDKEPEKAIVIRAGKKKKMDQEEILVGDLVCLAAGDEIPCDGVLTTEESIKTNESRMTGETLDIEKTFEKPFLFAGTEVRQGEGQMLAVAVGARSAYGRIMEALSGEVEATPLQIKLEKVAAVIGWLGAGVAIILFTVLTTGWAIRVVDQGLDFATEANALLDFFITAVTIIVVAVPEGLPLAVTVSLAYSMKKMYNDQCLVRVLSACETMGNVTTICSDKTGTLTTNKMTVVKCVLKGTHYEQIPRELDSDLKRLLIQGVVLNSKANTDQDAMDKNLEPESWKWKEGNQTEIALMAWLVRYGIHLEQERTRVPAVKSFPFDSIKKCSSTIVKNGEGLRRYYKGASENIVKASTKYMNTEGRVVPMDAEARARIIDQINNLTCQGLRTIGFGYYDLHRVEYDDTGRLVDPPDVDELVYFGVVGIKDPLRPESKDSVRKCQRAGIIVRMVTGDHVDTARFIAKECGILTSPNQVFMTGDEFRKLVNSGNQEKLREVIPKLRVLARSKPEDKETLVNWLKDNGEVVAATGDGTNDAPALKAANIGVAMFMVGTQVAKAASEINILDDNFASIVKAVVWGRSVYDNIRKFLQFQLVINVVALLVSLIGACSTFFGSAAAAGHDFHGNTTPLKAVQLLWVNLIMDTMAALALGTEVPTDALLDRNPYSPTAPLVSPIMWRNILGQSALQLVVLLFLLYNPWAIFGPGIVYQSLHHYTLIFNAFVFLQVFNEINSRKVNEEFNVFENFFTNYVFHLVLVFTVIMQWMMVEVFCTFAQTTPLSLEEWGITVALGALSLPWGLIVRLIPANKDSGRRKLPEDTFEGADWKN